ERAGRQRHLRRRNHQQPQRVLLGSERGGEQAVDSRPGYVYEEWMGCQGIAFARSTDRGRTFGEPVSLPGSVGSNVNSWDPALAVGPDGTVYAAFMVAKNADWFPMVARSDDHGATFSNVSAVPPAD